MNEGLFNKILVRSLILSVFQILYFNAVSNFDLLNFINGKMKLSCFKVILLFRIFSQQVLSVRNDEYKCGINRVNGGLVYGGREIIENEYPW